MNNWPLRYLLDNDPKKVMSKHGLVIRKIVNPLFRNVLIPSALKHKLIITRRAKIPKNRRVIFAPTHGFRDDVPCVQKTIGKQAYILCGSLPDFFETINGWGEWMNGVILVDRTDRVSRAASKDKMEYALNMGSNLVLFPEGIWDKSENKLVLDLFPGIYDIAKATGAIIMPMSLIQEGEYVYSILDEPFEITQYERQDGLRILRDKMATLKYELMEKYAVDKRSNYPKDYWPNHLKELTSEVEYYDFKVETSSHYIDKTIIQSEDVFRPIANIQNITPQNVKNVLYAKELVKTIEESDWQRLI